MKKIFLLLALLLLPTVVNAQVLDPREFKSIPRVTSLPSTAIPGQLYVLVNTLTADSSLHIYQTGGFVELGQVDVVTFTTLTATTGTITTLTSTTATITTLNATTLNFGAAAAISSTAVTTWTGLGLIFDLDAQASDYEIKLSASGSLYVYDNNVIVLAAGNSKAVMLKANTSAAAIVGAAQTLAVTANIMSVSAGAAADITLLTPGAATLAVSEPVTFICSDANLTFTDDVAPVATNGLAMAGNFVCSADDTISFVFDTINNYWVEKGRSVN